MSKPILSVDGVSTSFLGRGQWAEVTHGVSFDVMPRQTVALVGESGSGKSVTAMSVMRLHNAKTTRVSGVIRLDGQNLLDLSETQMNDVRGKRVGMIFQEPMTSLNPVMPVGEQIAEAILEHTSMTKSQAQAEAKRQLDRVRIPDAGARMREYPYQFSGGMRQRVMIAMALACGPELLIADEPTTALDVTIQAEIVNLIKALQEESEMSVLFITHDMGVVAEVADTTVVMRHGKIVETGTTEQIFRAPEMPYTRSLLSAVPKLGSMTGQVLPQRFAIADAQTGVLEDAKASIDTVDYAAPPALDVRNLTTRFYLRGGMLGRFRGKVHAVENVSFSLQRGETLSIVGESGCGKSTTGLSIMKLVTPEAGQIILEGEDITSLSPAQMRARRKRMQMIFQDPFASLNPRMTIGTAISEPLLHHRMATRAQAPDKVAALLEMVGLPRAMASRYPHQLSGGQRQRICIARALAVDPSVIVADESVSALDVSVKAQVVNLMLDLQEKLKLSYVFISHDMAVVERISHRVAVMYLGEILEIGSRADIFSNPQHDYTKKLLSAVPVADPARRQERQEIVSDEMHSPFRPLDYRVPERHYEEVSPGHLVRV